MAQFDVHAIKRVLTSLSKVRVERKGQDPKEILITGVSVAMANRLPSFYPPTDTAFFSRLVILPHDAVFYPDEETRKDLLSQGVDPSRLHPARSHDEILSDVEEEKPAILRLLIEDYIDLRDNHNLRPVESQTSRHLKFQYRESNDLIQQFINDYFTRKPEGFVTNDKLEYLFKEFSGQPKPKMKKIRDEIEERWHDITRDVVKIDGKTVRGLTGIEEKTCDRDGTIDTKLQKYGFSFSKNEKNEKSFIKRENGDFCNLVTENPENDLFDDPFLDTPGEDDGIY